MKRLAAAAVVLALVAIAAVWWFALSRTRLPADLGVAAPAPVETKAAPRAVSPPPASAVVPIPDPRGVVPAPVAIAPSSQVLRDVIRDATDLRALYERMKDLPDPTGERAYRLAEAIFECSVFADSPPEELSARLALTQAARESARRREVFSFMVERCKGFAGNPAALREITQGLHRRAEAAGYPAEVARALRSEASLRDVARADQVAMALFANPDAEVVHELAQYLNLRNMYLPQWRTGESATRSIAWGLLECQFGGDCGPRSRPVVMTCIAFGACDLQRVEEAVLVQGTQSTVNTAMAARDRLARQLAARDWAALGFIERPKLP
jgi:hypothetical protein